MNFINFITNNKKIKIIGVRTPHNKNNKENNNYGIQYYSTG